MWVSTRALNLSWASMWVSTRALNLSWASMWVSTRSANRANLSGSATSSAVRMWRRTALRNSGFSSSSFSRSSALLMVVMRAFLFWFSGPGRGAVVAMSASRSASRFPGLRPGSPFRNSGGSSRRAPSPDYIRTDGLGNGRPGRVRAGSGDGRMAPAVLAVPSEFVGVSAVVAETALAGSQARSGGFPGRQAPQARDERDLVGAGDHGVARASGVRFLADVFGLTVGATVDALRVCGCNHAVWATVSAIAWALVERRSFLPGLGFGQSPDGGSFPLGGKHAARQGAQVRALKTFARKGAPSARPQAGSAS